MDILKSSNFKNGNGERFSKTYTDAIVSNIRLAILDSKCTITWVNDKFCNLVMYEEHELVGRPISELSLVGIDEDEFKTIQSQLLSGRTWSGEIKSQTKQGSAIWVKTNIIPVLSEEGKAGSYLIVSSNITSTKKALEEKNEVMETLTRSEARYRALVENQPDLMSLCNAEGIRLFVNEKYSEFVGKHPHELIGTNIRELPFGGISPVLIDKIFQMTPQNKEVSGIFQLENFRGEKVWVSLCVQGIFDSEGKLFEILTTGRNVSNLKTAEIRLSNYIADLERIAFITSHKVRSPIATMLGLVELLRLNAIHSDQWHHVYSCFDQCLNELDLCTKELGAFINQSQTLRKEGG